MQLLADLEIMVDFGPSPPIPTAPGPWFRRHPVAAISVAVGSFVGVFALRMSVGDTEQTISVLYVLPIALLAISFGFRVGLVAGACGLALVVAWAFSRGVDLGPLGWLSVATPLLLLGGLLGVASDRLREAEQIERHAAAVAAIQRDAAEVNDELVQGLAATKWLFEIGDTERGLAMLEENLVSAQQLVSRMLASGTALPGDPRRSQPPH